ncbi:peptide transporter [Mycobacterium avium subsp. hominissuis]|uniref:ParB-like N-terminal domain-containing protein n=1 Tax=Mycobacterium paraffinicum TaxID=53378 RepID=A0ABP8RD41_9MYCO|nr:ParB/RepB/Spo0J family partition protein [Mycobacterium avium]ETA91898.1 peptide transporter [Mycobacterium avium 10-5581]PBJ36292.1 peptide transporter [Mycobacterium avium subsp. hominissuis]PBJ63755.1 peptide transporter [Mycobacterium avium subsp. hominissuis]QLK92846.1 ParB/RepB/Spo0J family partition protein [Mycobacterium avium subsp. hominissuis]QWY63665.1 ParB/RepB/Spo0J family partition protein [Mycobacterium avium subsp. hominissuis]
MARGQRTNLASLANSVGDHSPVEQIAAVPSRTAPLTELTANPRNPREDLGDLSNLESIADMQLQPAVVVTRAAYLALYPDDAIATRYVVINGCRRLAAAHKYGRTDLAIVVNDELARDRVTLISAAIAENVDRQDFDVIEEAKAVQSLVTECGSAMAAATRLRKTEAWVSQRRALLSLAPELQTALRRGELAIREARALARVPLEQQVARWQAAQDKKTEDRPPDRGADRRAPNPSRIIAAALRDFGSRPQLLADALRTHLGPDGVKTLLTVLAEEPTTT